MYNSAMDMCPLCFCLSNLSLVPFLGVKRVFIFVCTVLRTMVFTEVKDVFRRSCQTILESPEFGKVALLFHP